MYKIETERPIAYILGYRHVSIRSTCPIEIAGIPSFVEYANHSLVALRLTLKFQMFELSKHVFKQRDL